jgi:hypothetical protein
MIESDLEKAVALRLAALDVQQAEKLRSDAEEAVQRAQDYAEETWRNYHAAVRKLRELEKQS